MSKDKLSNSYSQKYLANISVSRIWKATTAMCRAEYLGTDAATPLVGNVGVGVAI